MSVFSVNISVKQTKMSITLSNKHTMWVSVSISVQNKKNLNISIKQTNNWFQGFTHLMVCSHLADKGLVFEVTLKIKVSFHFSYRKTRGSRREEGRAKSSAINLLIYEIWPSTDWIVLNRGSVRFCVRQWEHMGEGCLPRVNKHSLTLWVKRKRVDFLSGVSLSRRLKFAELDQLTSCNLDSWLDRMRSTSPVRSFLVSHCFLSEPDLPFPCSDEDGFMV